MAAVMAGCICFDWQRRHKWQFLNLTVLGTAALTGFLLSGTLEVLQIFSPDEYRRWFDPIDLMWQAVGAVVSVPVYLFCQRLWADGGKASVI